MEETSVIQLELGKEFGGTGPHLEVELEKVTMVATVISLWGYNLSSHLKSWSLFTSPLSGLVTRGGDEGGLVVGTGGGLKPRPFRLVSMLSYMPGVASLTISMTSGLGDW